MNILILSLSQESDQDAARKLSYFSASRVFFEASQFAWHIQNVNNHPYEKHAIYAYIGRFATKSSKSDISIQGEPLPPVNFGDYV